MEEIRIWINSEDSINIVTNVGIDAIKNGVKSFKTNLTTETGDLESYLKGYFGNSITIIPRVVEEFNYSDI